MNVEKISKLAYEMLMELAEGDESLEVQMLKQRLKTVLVWKSIRPDDFVDADTQRDEAVSALY